MPRRSPVMVLSGFQSAGNTTALDAIPNICTGRRISLDEPPPDAWTSAFSYEECRTFSDVVGLHPMVSVFDAVDIHDYGSRDLLRESGEVANDPFPARETADAA